MPPALCHLPCTCRHACRAQLASRMESSVLPGYPPPLAPRTTTARAAAGEPATAARTESRQHKFSGNMTLEDVRSSLIRQEDTIIFNIIERAEFARNAAVYTPGGVAVPAFRADGSNYTFLEYLLRESEAVHGKVRRYTVPDERAFFPEALPPTVRASPLHAVLSGRLQRASAQSWPWREILAGSGAAQVLPPVAVENMLHRKAGAININLEILDVYLHTILPAFTAPGDDGQYGSSAMYDVLLLQALSKRIHWGAFVAEAKFSADPAAYSAAISAADADALLAMLTFPEQEASVVARVRSKAATFGQDVNAAGDVTDGRYKVAPDLVASLYRDWVMPLTKKVQVQYLLHRLDE